MTHGVSIKGTFQINGHNLEIQQLAKMIAYVSFEELYPWLTVKQTLFFMSAFKKSATGTFKIENMVWFSNYKLFKLLFSIKMLNLRLFIISSCCKIFQEKITSLFYYFMKFLIASNHLWLRFFSFLFSIFQKLFSNFLSFK